MDVYEEAPEYLHNSAQQYLDTRPAFSELHKEHYSNKGSVFQTLYRNMSEDGFLYISPSSDSKVFYVSSSEGNDENDCLSENSACQTITNALRKAGNKSSDQVLLKRGDSWENECGLSLKSGLSPIKPFVFSFYGNQDNRPKINCARKFLSPNLAVKNVAIIGLEFNAYKLNNSSVSFTGLKKDIANVMFLGPNKNIVFEDNKFNYSELIFQGSGKGFPENIILRRNIWTGAYYNESSISRDKRPSNIFLHSVEGILAEENIIDSGGWNNDVANAGANQFNHNVYIQHNSNGNRVYFLNNIITRASSHGIHGRPGGTYHGNFFAKNAVNLQLGYKGYPLNKSSLGIALNNVISEGSSMIKGDNACSEKNLCTSARWGLRLEELGASNRVAIIGNVVSHLDANSQWNAKYNKLNTKAISHDGSINNIYFLNNITWDWESGTSKQIRALRNPNLKLADYASALGLNKSFDSFMEVALNRPIQTWDERFSARKINSFIRLGLLTEK